MIVDGARRLFTSAAPSGPFTLDDVRNDQSSYQWNGPLALHGAMLFASDGTDFGGTQRNLALNACSYDTGVDGGITVPGGTGLAAEWPQWSLTPTISGGQQSIVILARTADTTPPEFSAGLIHQSLTDRSEFEIRTPDFRMGFTSGSNATVPHGAFAGNEQTFACVYIADDPTNQVRMMMHDGTDSGLLGKSVFGSDNWLMRFVGRSNANSGPLYDATINAVIGMSGVLTMQQLQDFHSNPASWFSQI